MPYNLISCAGWEAGSGWFGSGACIGARLGIVLLFFIVAIARKWLGEEMGLNFSFLWALVLSLVPYFLVITIFGSAKIAMLVGIIGLLIGGFGVGYLFGSGSDGGYY